MAYRVVKQEFWNDEKVVDIFSVEDKYFFLYLLTNPHTNQLGVYKLPLKIAAFELGYSKEQIIVLIDRFSSMGIIKYNIDTQEIAVGNYLAHSIIKGGKPVMDAVLKDIDKVTDLHLLKFAYEKMQGKTINNETIYIILNNIKEYLINNNIYINNNDNDVSSTIRTTIRTTIRKNKSDLEKLEHDFEIIYKIYEKKGGKAEAFRRYCQWVSASGKKVNGRVYHLTNRQIWDAVKKYVDIQKSNDTDLQYYKNFDVLMGNSLLDYVESEDK